MRHTVEEDVSARVAAGGHPFTASGDSHPAANLPHSASSATIQEPPSATSQATDDNPLLARLKERQRTRATETSPHSKRKRLRKETTVLHYNVSTTADPHLESPTASTSGGGHPAVRQTLQDVVEFGRLPKEINNPATETEVAEQRLTV